MAKAIPDRALAELLSFEDEKDNKVLAEDALPTLNERVELFLRAKYGEDRIFTASERAAARARILDAMEDYYGSEIDARVRDLEALYALWRDRLLANSQQSHISARAAERSRILDAVYARAAERSGILHAVKYISAQAAGYSRI
jgi:hypothetical protein